MNSGVDKMASQNPQIAKQKRKKRRKENLKNATMHPQMQNPRFFSADFTSLRMASLCRESFYITLPDSLGELASKKNVPINCLWLKGVMIAFLSCVVTNQLTLQLPWLWPRQNFPYNINIISTRYYMMLENKEYKFSELTLKELYGWQIQVTNLI